MHDPSPTLILLAVLLLVLSGMLAGTLGGSVRDEAAVPAGWANPRVADPARGDAGGGGR